MPMKSDREYREMTLSVKRAEEEQEQEEEKKVRGYATTFNEPYVLFEDDEFVFREQVAPTAFDKCDMDDVIMQYDHNGRVFARTSNGTLSVNPDERGLLIEADLSGTEIGRNLFEEIAGGYTTKMSFGFIVSESEETKTKADDGKADILRTIKGISKLFDVSAVSLPANEGTSIGATRSRIDGVIEEIRAERLEAEKLALEKLRTEVRARALGKEKENDNR